MPAPENHFEVAVIGGGPAGSAAAAVLARAQRRVLVIEKCRNESFKVGESLPPAVLPLLDELGMRDRFVEDGHLISYGTESAWGSDKLQGSDFIRDPNGHGWHLDRPRFDSMLREGARASGAQVLDETRVSDAHRDTDGRWRLKFDPGSHSQQVCAEWLIDCTGRRSWLARREGVKRETCDRLIAFVAVFARRDSGKSEPDRDSLTLIESVRDGWWYTSLLPNEGRVVVFFTDADTPTARKARRLPAFSDLLSETIHIRKRLDDFCYVIESDPMATSANTARLERMHGDRWLAAGDACVSFDPLSSQGILTALYSGLKAGRALDSHFKGDSEALNGYSDNIDAVFDAYLKNRSLFYGYEQRWPHSPFWKSRR
jgi:flavin-dependent dehydrogenase